MLFIVPNNLGVLSHEADLAFFMGRWHGAYLRAEAGSKDQNRNEDNRSRGGVGSGGGTKWGGGRLTSGQRRAASTSTGMKDT